MPKTKKTDRLTLLGEAQRSFRPRRRARVSKRFRIRRGANYWIHFETDDFTSLCPVTGQADFARIDIDYVPDRFASKASR